MIAPLVDAILGKPWAWGGRGPDRFYCLGIWLYLLEAVLCRRLEDPLANRDPGALLELSRVVKSARGDSEPLDLLYWRGLRGPHVATVEDGRWVVDSSETLGVHRAPLAEALARAERRYRLRW